MNKSLAGEQRRRTTLDFFEDSGVFELDASILGDDFREEVRRCIAAQKQAARATRSAFRPNPRASAEVSPETLAELLARGKDVHGIAKQRHISDVIVFGADSIPDAIESRTVATLREKIDDAAHRVIKAVFPGVSGLVVGNSGHFWYPQGSYMGWHTNSGAPGWRIYINYAEEPGKSFFRYRHPQTAEIVTLMDREWNIRVFQITRADPLWHAVYSDTNRFSLGYIVYRRGSPIGRIKRGLKALIG